MEKKVPMPVNPALRKAFSVARSLLVEKLQR